MPTKTIIKQGASISLLLASMKSENICYTGNFAHLKVPNGKGNAVSWFVIHLKIWYVKGVGSLSSKFSKEMSQMFVYTL